MERKIIFALIIILSSMISIGIVFYFFKAVLIVHILFLINMICGAVVSIYRHQIKNKLHRNILIFIFLCLYFFNLAIIFFFKLKTPNSIFTILVIFIGLIVSMAYYAFSTDYESKLKDKLEDIEFELKLENAAKKIFSTKKEQQKAVKEQQKAVRDLKKMLNK